VAARGGSRHYSAAAQFAERAADPDRSGVTGALRIFVVPHAIVQLDARTAALRSAAAHCQSWRAIEVHARELPRNYWIAGLLGAYACVIAASPNAVAAAAWSLPPVAIPLVLWTLQTPSRWLWCFFFAALLLPPLPFALGNSGPHVAWHWPGSAWSAALCGSENGA
jgi:hypothetical protein